MKLSVIIVNYNVKYFLEHCLHSVQKAVQNIEAEIIVVDNNSSDGSVEYLKERFAEVVFMENRENLGFGRANNRGLEQCSGDYILFLNPDTIVSEDSFQKCIDVFESDPSVGAIGVRMVDGSGVFLKESKRAFPSPTNSLYKLFGLSSLFPRSAVFSEYHLGNLDEHANHEVDVLSGAFMMVRKKVLDKTGGFDKTFFMYGEDIDLSYRIQKAGYKNYYLADTTIIHFKGESTNKGSLNYVKMFYQAMAIFVKKHYGGAKRGLFVFLLQFGIWLRALLSVFSGFVRKTGLVVMDAALFLSSFWLVKALWSNFIKTETVYPATLLWVVFSVFTISYLAVAWLWGLYDKAGYKTKNIIYAAAVAIVLLMAFYSLLPEHYRFSRGIVLAGSALGFTLALVLRLLLTSGGVIKTSEKDTLHLVGLVVGNNKEYESVLDILKKKGEAAGIIGRVGPLSADGNIVGNLQNLKQIQKQTQAQKIVFCTASPGYKPVIEAMETLPRKLFYRFYDHEAGTIISSHFKNGSGAADMEEKNLRLNDPFQRRLKRLFDVSVSLFFLLTFPLHLFLVRKPLGFLYNIFSVLTGKNTWVGYASKPPRLAALKPGIISINGPVVRGVNAHHHKYAHRLDNWYAREYSTAIDLSRLVTFYRQLGCR